MKYSEIRNLDQLRRAEDEVRRKIERKKQELNSGYDGIRESFAPVNLFASGLKTVSKQIPFDTILLRGVRKLLSKLK